MPDVPRYTLSPLERRGVILGLEAGQLATIGGGTFTAVVVHEVVGGAAGILLGLLVTSAAVTGAVWTRDGRPLVLWGLLGGAWLRRRIRQPELNPAPTQGSPGRRAGLPAGIEVYDRAGGPGSGHFGVIRDRLARTWAAVVPVQGRSFSLLDPAEQAQRLDAWRAVLAAAGRPGGPMVRLQWIQRSGPADDHLTGPAGIDPSGNGGVPADPACASYRRLVEQVAGDTHRHDSWVVLVVGAERRSHGADGGEILGRELRFLDGQLRQADLDPGPVLSASDLLRMVGAGAMARQEMWSCLRVDADWHVTYWLSEWPRVEVGPAFLLPLLMGRGRRTVSLVMSPVSADRAIREVRSARTADVADAQLRSRAGFLASARRDREAEGVTRREHELAEGHAEYRFSGYVSVTAGDPDGLDLACSELEHAAQAAHLELRRLYGRQAEAWTWTLPLGRGLR